MSGQGPDRDRGHQLVGRRDVPARPRGPSARRRARGRPGTRPDAHARVRRQVGHPDAYDTVEEMLDARAARRPHRGHAQPVPLPHRDRGARARAARPVREAGRACRRRGAAPGRPGRRQGRHDDGAVHLPVHARHAVPQGARGRGVHRAAVPPQHALLRRIRAAAASTSGGSTSTSRAPALVGRPRVAPRLPRPLVLRRGRVRHRRVRARSCPAADRPDGADYPRGEDSAIILLRLRERGDGQPPRVVGGPRAVVVRAAARHGAARIRGHAPPRERLERGPDGLRGARRRDGSPRAARSRTTAGAAPRATTYTRPTSTCSATRRRRRGRSCPQPPRASRWSRTWPTASPSSGSSTRPCGAQPRGAASRSPRSPPARAELGSPRSAPGPRRGLLRPAGLAVVESAPTEMVRISRNHSRGGSGGMARPTLMQRGARGATERRRPKTAPDGHAVRAGAPRRAAGAPTPERV